MNENPGINEVSRRLIVVPLSVPAGMPGPNAFASTVLPRERQGMKRVPCNSNRRPKNREGQAGFQAMEPVASRHRPVSAPPMASLTGPAPCRKCPSVANRAGGESNNRTVDTKPAMERDQRARVVMDRPSSRDHPSLHATLGCTSVRDSQEDGACERPQCRCLDLSGLGRRRDARQNVVLLQCVAA
jgi:hypothetical protein